MKKLLFSLATCLMMGTATCQVQALSDTSMEASGAANNGLWTSTSTTFGTTWCDLDLCGDGGGPMVARTGSWYSWFGGITGAETGTVSQTFNVATAGTAELKFWWVIPLRQATDVFKVRIDGVDKYTLASGTTVFTTYQEVTVALGNLSAGSHTIQFYSFHPAGSVVHNVALDDVTLNVTSPTAGTQNIDLSAGISVYTNPADNTITISNKTSERNAEITFYEASGKLSNKNSYDISNPVVISTKGWNSGMYILNIKTGRDTISKKVIVK